MRMFQALTLILFVLAPPLGGVMAAPEPPSPIAVPNPGSDLWRAVRQRDDVKIPMRTQAPRVDDHILINPYGEYFRQVRREKLIVYSGYLIAATFLILVLFYLVKGPIRVPEGDSGEKIQRFKRFDIIVHWVVAATFLVLALTGTLLLFGRFIIIPWLGIEAFGPVALAGKWIHNLVGPLFIASLVVMFVRYVSKNIPHFRDLVWLLRLGGAIGKGHAPAGFFNGGEKVWFWSLMFFGLILSVSGVVLDFPFLIDSARDPLALALTAHAIAAVLVFAFALGHMYLGSIGTEGTMNSMKSGWVDKNWARMHHGIWYETVEKTTGRLGKES